MESLFVSLAGATTLGLTALAYRQPKQYRRLYPWLVALLIAALAFGAGYTVGMGTAIKVLLPMVDPEKLDLAMKVTDNVTPHWSVYLAFVVLSLYLQILLWLDAILGLSSESKNDYGRHVDRERRSVSPVAATPMRITMFSALTFDF